MKLIDGNQISREILRELAEEAHTLKGPVPTVAFIRVGDDPASVSYVAKKQRVAGELGFASQLHALAADIQRDALYALIDSLNADAAVHGILVQSPLPGHLNERDVFNRVSPDKDVDGFHTVNLGRLCQEDAGGFVACTPAGVVELMHRCGIETAGKQVAVVGRSLIVGKPLALLLMRKGEGGDATVTVCHSRTPDLAGVVKRADIVIAAIGRPRFITADMVKDGAVVIDVGINRVDDPSRKSGYRLVGDVDFDAVAPKCSWITPVPGGVGPMTVAMLMRNTLKAWHRAAPKT